MRAPIFLLPGSSSLFEESDFEGHPIVRATRIPAEAMLREASLICCEWPISPECAKVLPDARRQACPTLCVLRTPVPWDRTEAIAVDRVACIGRSQARQFEAFGNKCEVIGIPSLDPLTGESGQRSASPQRRVLLWGGERETGDGLFNAAAGWIAQGGKLADTDYIVGHSTPDGDSLFPKLHDCDAVVTTDCAVLLYAILLGKPSALLSDAVRPSPVTPAWQISSTEWLEGTVREMLNPSPARLLFQDTVLHEGLECETPAMPRWALLLREMIRLGEHARDQGSILNLPARLVPRPRGDHHGREARFSAETLFDWPGWLERDEGRLRALLHTRIRFARPSPQPSPPAENIRVRLAARGPGVVAPGNDPFFVHLVVENLSDWALRSAGAQPVHASYQWLDAAGTIIADGVRTAVDIPGRETRAVAMRVVAPSQPGDYDLLVTLVQEGRFWFHGVNPAFQVRHHVTVSADGGLDLKNRNELYAHRARLHRGELKSKFHFYTWLFSCDNRNRGIIRLNFDEAALLWESVKCTSGPILEIGRRHAGSTVLLLAASGSRQVTSVDIKPEHHPACDSILRDFRERLHLLVQNSGHDLPPEVGGRFGLVFVDGDHSHFGVLRDVMAHWSRLKSFDEAPPLAVFHDAVPNEGLAYAGELNHCEGVREVCNALVYSGCAKVLASAGSMLVLEKLGELPAGFPLP